MVDDFIEQFVKFKHETVAVVAMYREVYQDIQKKAEQLRITSSSQSLLPHSVLCILHHSVTLTISSQNASDIPLNMITSVLMFISG